VLVVEDQPEVRQMTVRALRDGGFLTLEAADGLEALAVLENGHPAVRLVLTDLALPNLGGLALAHELDRRQPGLPVLFMTGYTSDESIRRSALLRGHALIEKPFDAELVVRRLRQALDDGESGRPVA
jgi:CheY-like chemotaxis protein